MYAEAFKVDAPENNVAITEYIREGDKFVPVKVEPTYLLFGKKLPGL